MPSRGFRLGLGANLRQTSVVFFVRYNTKRNAYDEGDESVRNFFGRRRSGRSTTVGGGAVRRGRTVRGGSSSGTVELAIGTLVIVVLVVVLLRLLGLL